MKHSKRETRNAKQIRNSNCESHVGRARSVPECGGPPPLSIHPGSSQSARGLAHSKTWRSVGFCLLFSALCFAAFAQYSIDWSTIDGGGGTSTGGVYSVSGTIGQPDAGGPMTNGQYSVTGGFWALPQAVQIEGAPTLTIAPAGAGLAQISWTPATGTNWVLQERLSLSPTAWTNAPSGTNNPATIPATMPTKFYRLHKP